MKITDLKNYTVVSSASVPTAPKTPSSVGQKVLNAGTNVANFFGAKGISEQFGADIARARAPQAEKNLVEYPKPKQVLGSAIQTGANFIPGAGKGVGLLGKTIAGAGTGYAFDVGSKLQNNAPKPLSPGVATAVGGALPGAGATIGLGTKIVSRLLKGLGSGLSGVSTKTIDSIVNNPNVAKEASRRLSVSGNDKVLEENARQIIEGVSKIRQEARRSFGIGLDQLSKQDIDPATFRTNTQGFLDKYGITKTTGKRDLGTVEFSDPKNTKKANELIDRLQNAELDGKSLRKLADDIENSKYKTAIGDERLSFNAFINDLSASLKNAINSSTGKLDSINKKFSGDMQLVEAVEDIFGNVQFKNLPEIVKASQKLENLFTQKGLAPKVVDDFLARIGVSPKNFRTTEAVRQIAGKESGTNTKGLSVGEIIQQTTSSIVTPQMVKNLSIATGLSTNALKPILESMKPKARAILINALLQENQ